MLSNTLKRHGYSNITRLSHTMPSTHYQALIIGSGQGGTPLAQAFAKAGQKTALIESSHVGGCCINEGCTPTKTMIASGRVAYLTKRAGDYGVGFQGDAEVDMKKVRERKRDIVESFRSGSEKRIKDAGIDLMIGTARFIDSKTVAVSKDGGEGEQKVTADKIFINTGARPSRPPINGLEADFPPGIILDSTSVQELGEVPEHLVVIGGGYIGLEFGQLFRRLGAKVTVLQRGAQLLPREDKEVAGAMLEILKQDGLTVHLNTAVHVVVPATSGSGAIITVQDQGGKNSEITSSHVLLAIGRTANTDVLDAKAAGVAMDKAGYIKVNDKLETNQPHIWALGDVKGGPAFTHVSYDDFRILRANVVESKEGAAALSIKDRDLITPYTVYTDPQLGHVGLHYAEAKARYPNHTIKCATMPMSYVARALETDESRGMMKAVVNMDTGKILGFTCLGLEGGEIMSVVQMAMIGGAKWTDLRDAIWAHPTLAESLNNIWGFLE